MPIGEAFLSVSLDVLFGKLASAVISELGKLYGMKDELAKLRRTLERLQKMLHDAEQKKVEGLQSALWLRELKCIACEAEDVVEEFQYEDARCKVKNSLERRSGARSECPQSTSWKLGKFCSSLSPQAVSFRYKMARRIDGIRRRLDEISKDRKDLDVGGTSDVGVNQLVSEGTRRETSSLLGDREVFGRDELKEELVRLLLGTTDHVGSAASIHPTSLSVLSIVGMGGLGKTTLAKLVYHNKQVQDYFHEKVWVFVSPVFDLKKLTKQILEHVVGPQSGLQNIDSLNVLQQKLSQQLKGKRFLLVLDDVWEEDCNGWREFSAPLTQAAEGSKVLITTRNQTFANSVQSVKIQLAGLSFEECWSIFKQHAFTPANSDKHPLLEPIGKEIVKKLKGIPLAATTVGGLLRFESEERKWRDVLDDELWELKRGGEVIFSALRMSYEYLPPHLKQCFAYCCVFHKGCRFDKLELVQLWMAQGYVQSSGRKHMEDVGNECFNELISRSLIQSDDDDKYFIHDLLHDLGQLVLKNDCYHVRPGQVQKIPEDVDYKFHLRLDYEESLMGELEVLCKFKSLRTLSFVFSGFSYIQIPLELFRTVKALRVLDLSYSSLDTLPDSVGCLIHLRYIDLTRTKIKCLPDSICELYMLQTLRLKGCDELNVLPDGMSNMISLCYLEADQELVSKIADVWKLTHLQYLEAFSVSKKNGYKIGYLQHMNQLRGKLCIRNLHEVEGGEVALEARLLRDKQFLQVLEMEWAGGRHVDSTDVEESIIEGLQPPPELKGLVVKCYAGVKFPRWMNGISVPSLESLCLRECTNLSLLPPLPQLNSLRTVDISSCPLTGELPHLPTALTNLILCQIPKLKLLPLLPATLKELTVECLGLEVLPEVLSEGHQLSILKIHGCPHLSTLHEGLLNHHLRQLQVLSIKDCTELVNWPKGEGFRTTLSSLEGELTIEKCPKLEAFPEGSELHPSLKKLAVEDCPRVANKSLFSQVHNFSSDDVFVWKQYDNWTHCVDEALQHMQAVDWLHIQYLPGTHADAEESPPPSSPPVYFKYNREESFSWERGDKYMSRHLRLEIRGRRRGRPSVDVDAGVTAEDDSCKLLCTCLDGRVWTSSLRKLTLDGIPDTAFIALQHNCNPERGPGGGGEEEGDKWGDGEAPPRHPLLRLPSLETLGIWNCTEMRRLPTEVLLSHSPSLKVLAIDGCPELTWSSVEEGIRSLPSLQQLQICRCPNLLVMPPPSPLLNNGGGTEDAAALSAPPALRLSGQPPLLRHFFTDDTRLLTRRPVNITSPYGQNTGRGTFLKHLLTSLRYLRIFRSKLTSLTAEEEEGLRTLASSLHFLGFKDCPNLEHLPGDLRALLPNLKVLVLTNCPMLRRLPDGGLPASLEFVKIETFPELTKRCRQRPTRPSTRGAEEDGDWQKMAHVPVIQVDTVWLRGSFSKFTELKAQWDFIF